MEKAHVFVHADTKLAIHVHVPVHCTICTSIEFEVVPELKAVHIRRNADGTGRKGLSGGLG